MGKSKLLADIDNAITVMGKLNALFKSDIATLEKYHEANMNAEAAKIAWACFHAGISETEMSEMVFKAGGDGFEAVRCYWNIEKEVKVRKNG